MKKLLGYIFLSFAVILLPATVLSCIINDVEKAMLEAAKNLDFERATELRDILFELRSKI